MASAALPARAEKCFWVATIQAQANTPTTIEGVPLSTSATKRVTQVSRLPGYSAQWIPAAMPIGRPIRLATPTMMSVPTMACATPPPVSPAGAGIFVKKSSERLPAPFATRLSRMNTSGSSATITAPIMRPTMRLLNARRSMRRFTAPCSRPRSRGRPAR
jgi:hypothetical protein